jgi:hypothetical protein
MTRMPWTIWVLSIIAAVIAVSWLVSFVSLFGKLIFIVVILALVFEIARKLFGQK